MCYSAYWICLIPRLILFFNHLKYSKGQFCKTLYDCNLQFYNCNALEIAYITNLEFTIAKVS